MEGLGNLLTFDNLNGPLAYTLSTGYGIYTDQRNYNAQKSWLNYQKQLQQQIFAREDNAVQRRAKDMKAAGFSPYLAAGNAAGAGTVVSTAAPHMDNSVSPQLSSYLQYKLNASQANANIDRTKAEELSIKNSAELTRKNIELAQLQIDWYKNHPGYAPGVTQDKTILGTASSMLGEYFSNYTDLRNRGYSRLEALGLKTPTKSSSSSKNNNGSVWNNVQYKGGK